MLFIKYLQLEEHAKLYTNPLLLSVTLHLLVSVLVSWCSYLVYLKCSTTTTLQDQMRTKYWAQTPATTAVQVIQN